MPNVQIYLQYFVFYTSLCMSLDDLPKIRGLDVYIWNVVNVEKNAFILFYRSKHLSISLQDFLFKFLSALLFLISLPYLQICSGMYFESQKDPIFLLISRLLTFARRKQFYAYDSDNFKKIENMLKYNANIYKTL